MLHSHGISYQTTDVGSVVYNRATTAMGAAAAGACDKATALEDAVYNRNETNHNQYTPKNIPIRKATSEGGPASFVSSCATIRSCMATESGPTRA
eukprot:scaffold2290_cov170-Amphora_coffeaeformis.AAC.27